MTGLIPQLMGPAIESSNPQSSHPAHPPSAGGSGFGCRLATFIECTLTLRVGPACSLLSLRGAALLAPRLSFRTDLAVGGGKGASVSWSRVHWTFALMINALSLVIRLKNSCRAGTIWSVYDSKRPAEVDARQDAN